MTVMYRFRHKLLLFAVWMGIVFSLMAAGVLILCSSWLVLLALLLTGAGAGGVELYAWLSIREQHRKDE